MWSNGPASKVVYPRLSAHTKCWPPRDRTSGPQFRLGEICGAQGFCWPAGCACNTTLAVVRLYLFPFHLSMGTCPLHPWISRAQSHYCGKHSFCLFFFLLLTVAKGWKRFWNLHTNIQCDVLVLFFCNIVVKIKKKKRKKGRQCRAKQLAETRVESMYQLWATQCSLFLLWWKRKEYGNYSSVEQVENQKCTMCSKYAVQCWSCSH